MTHCSNCHADFEPDGRQLCPPCRRAFVMGVESADGGDSMRSYRAGRDSGRMMENREIGDAMKHLDERGVTLTSARWLMWPEDFE